MKHQQPPVFERILDKLLNINRFYKRLLQVVFDGIVIIVCYALAMALRLDGFDYINRPRVWYVLVPVIPITIVLFVRLGLYRVVLRYISSTTLKLIVFGVLASGLALLVISQLFTLPVPRSVPIIYSVLLFCMIGGARFGLRAFYRLRIRHKKINVVIYGAGDTGRQLFDGIKYVGDYNVIAFIDDDKELHGQEISAIRVYAPDALERLKQQYDLQMVLLAIPRASRAERRRAIERAERAKVQIKTIPPLGDLISGKAEVSDLNFVQVDELLGRDIVPPDPRLMKAQISGRVVMVTGAGGSIGSELCRQIIRQKPKCLVLFEISEFALYQIHNALEIAAKEAHIKLVPLIGSVQDSARVTEILTSFQVQTIYHAAAYKHVPLVEQNIAAGIYNNIFGTKTVLEASLVAGVEAFTLISTDKAVRPTNIMGASKRVAELICQSIAANTSDMRIAMVRFGNVLGSSGSVILRFQAQIKSGGPVTVTHPKITRFFMTITEAAQLVIQASAMAKGGDVFVLDMGEPVAINELAHRMIRLHGLQPYYEDSGLEEQENGDICIQFTGLRPGEKLYEELLIGQNATGTQHPLIMTADEVYLEPSRLDPWLADLMAACETVDIDEIRNLLQAIPIGFTPETSPIDLLWLEKLERFAVR